MKQKNQQTPLVSLARRATWLWIAVAVVAGAFVLASSPADAQEPEGDVNSASAEGVENCPVDLSQVSVSDSNVRIAQVTGLIDPIVYRFLLDEIDQAEADGSLALVLWINSEGIALSDAQFNELASALDETDITIVAWVGQTGADALGGSAQLVGLADIIGMTPQSSLGRTGPSMLPDSIEPGFGELARRMETEALGPNEAIETGVAVGPLENSATIGSFLTSIDGYEVFQCATETGQLATIPRTQNRIAALSLIPQQFHSAASPEVTFLFFMVGLWLLVFELYTAGIGIAGLLGAGFVALGGYGMAVLPVRPWAVVVLLASTLCLAVDVQTNVPRGYTISGLLLFGLGATFLYDGVSLSWVTAILMGVAAVLYAFIGMPNMVRTRFSTPTIGRKWMIGAMGTANVDLKPSGTVTVKGVSWRAVTNRATPISAGDSIRVVGLDRLLLEVEPEEGGARDYRDRRSKKSSASVDGEEE